MKKINLIYWNENNFGDILNPELVMELTGYDIQYKEFEASRKKKLNQTISHLLSFQFDRLKTINFPWQKTLICIGSIITWSNSNTHVWGAGFMNEHESFRGGKILAVRGKLTHQKLLNSGFQSPGIFGDGALILPLWIKPQKTKKYKLGIIPHWKEVDYFIEKYANRYKIIDLRTNDIRSVIDDITSCEHILSTSLHGIIVPHAYNIPALWIKNGYIDTDGFKFDDYFSSVDIPFYKGFENFDKILASEQNWKAVFEQNKSLSLIQNSLEKIQYNLLSSFPYKLREKYQNIVKTYIN